MITLVGGTFNYFHKGHEELLRAAYNTGNRVIIGLSSESYVSKHKNSKIGYERRKERVESFMNKLTGNYEIHPLETSEGNTLEVSDAVLVVSPETYKNALRINNERIKLNKEPLKIIKIPFVLAEDLFPISSTRIMNKEISRYGKRKKTIRIAISTENDLKIKSANSFISGFMKNYEIIKNKDYKTGAEQPFGDDTIRFARDRAMYGLKDNDYSIGIESGIIYNSINNVYYDVHYCTVVDRYSRLTTGISSGFEMPGKVIDSIKSGVSTNNFVYREYGIENTGKHSGLIGIASGNRITRSGLVYEAVRNAFIPRFSPDLYGLDFD
ncbi:MAG: pantetheine-phosphate adenylyltransferase [Ferroplasma sp.]